MIKKNEINKYFKYINCPVCNAKEYNVRFESTLSEKDLNNQKLVDNFNNSLDDYTKHSRIVKCTKCNITYVNPIEDLKISHSAYVQVEDDLYIQTEKYRKILLTKHFNKIMKYKKSGRILDIGSFAGYFLEIAKSEGWKVEGIEPSKWASKEARKRGVKVIGHDIYNVKLSKNRYDAISMLDVIEHLPDPHKLLLKAHYSLKKGGILEIATPDIESYFAKILGDYCPFLIRMHIILYSPKTLIPLLEKKGFEVVEISHYGRTYPISYIIGSLHFTNKKFESVIFILKDLPIIKDLIITLNFHDSFRLIAIKK